VSAVGQTGTANHEADNRVIGHSGERRFNFLGGSFDDSRLYRHCSTSVSEPHYIFQHLENAGPSSDYLAFAFAFIFLLAAFRRTMRLRHICIRGRFVRLPDIIEERQHFVLHRIFEVDSVSPA
jgi:hypothetical protein